MSELTIPNITPEEVAQLSTRIKPVVTVTVTVKVGQAGVPAKYHIKDVDPFKVSYVWDPEPTEQARNLSPLADIRTLHTYGFYGLFKPSIAEVLAQIPKELIDKTVAFEIIKCPGDVDDLNREQEALNEGFHVATTRLYMKSTDEQPAQYGEGDGI